MRYKVKSMDVPTALLNEMGATGDHVAMRALADWHGENPGHPQEQAVKDHLEFLNKDEKTSSLRHFHDDPKERMKDRVFSIHADLTGRPIVDEKGEPTRKGDLVGYQGIETSLHGHVGKVTSIGGPCGAQTVRVSIPTDHDYSYYSPTGGYEIRYRVAARDILKHQATIHREQKERERAEASQQDQRKSLAQIWLGSGRKSLGETREAAWAHLRSGNKVKDKWEGDITPLHALADMHEEEGDTKTANTLRRAVPYVSTDLIEQGAPIKVGHFYADDPEERWADRVDSVRDHVEGKPPVPGRIIARVSPDLGHYATARLLPDSDNLVEQHRYRSPVDSYIEYGPIQYTKNPFANWLETQDREAAAKQDQQKSLDQIWSQCNKTYEGMDEESRKAAIYDLMHEHRKINDAMDAAVDDLTESERSSRAQARMMWRVEKRRKVAELGGSAAEGQYPANKDE